MGIFTTIFNDKDDSFNKEVNDIIVLLKNLGLLERSIISNKVDNSDLLDKLDLSLDKNTYNTLKKYYELSNLGYGSDTIKEVKKKLYDSKHNKSFSIINNYIEEYKDILRDISNIVNIYEKSNMNKVDLMLMIDFTAKQFMENKLGYPLNLDDEIEKRVNNLKELKYDGCGREVIDKFKNDCNKIIREKDSATSRELIKDIDDAYYKPILQRYDNDLSNLETKIDRLNSNRNLNSSEKEHKKEELILDFNEHYGHDMSIDSLIEKYSNKLSKIDDGGYSMSKIKKFSHEAKERAITESLLNKSKVYVAATIKTLYNKYLNNYLNKKKELTNNLEKIKDSSLPSTIKMRRETAIKANFQREVSMNDTPRERLDYMTDTLKTIKCSSKRIDDFRSKALNKMESTSDKDSLSVLEDVYLELLTDTKSDINIYLDNLVSKLRTLPGGGYGDGAIKEFRDNLKEIIESDESLDDKMAKLMEQYNIYKNNYEENIVLFNEWEKERLRDYKGDKEKYSKKLDSRVKKMLSLSPRQMDAYLIEDDAKKKDAFDTHNTRVILNYLAEEEYKNTKNKNLYAKRLKEIEEGLIPYSKNKISNAKDSILKDEFFSDSVDEDNKIISDAEFIDSTLIKQISDASHHLKK